MNGVKSMSIFKQVENSDDQIEIWTLSTNDFDEWEEGKVFIEESRNYQVLFIWFNFLKIEYIYMRKYFKIMLKPLSYIISVGCKSNKRKRTSRMGRFR